MIRTITACLLTLAVLPAWAIDLSEPSLKRDWPNTDFSNLAVKPEQIISGGVPKDGIPAVDNPKFHPVPIENTLAGPEPVMVLEQEGSTPRAYPLRYLIWHEIVNDEVDGIPVAVTFCPLCNSGLIFDRRLDGKVLDFGVSGFLRYSDMIMFDRQTETWWQQFSGRGNIGEKANKRLIALPAWLESWQSFRARNPNGLVMKQPDGSFRPYGRNPYEGYDSREPFLYQGENPPHGIDPVARVLRVKNRAWPLERLRKAGELEEEGLRITWTAGQASALDAGVIAEGRDVGDIRVFNAETNEPVVHEVIFAFAFHAFKPKGTWMLGE
ncbi:MAG: DUF3179 domain-containing protein [Pseudomonadota bacterium]